MKTLLALIAMSGVWMLAVAVGELPAPLVAATQDRALIEPAEGNLNLEEPESVTFPTVWIKWALGGLATLLGAGIIAAGRAAKRLVERHDTEIESLHSQLRKTVDKETYETSRREIREDINVIHKKLESVDQRGEERHGQVMSAIVGGLQRGRP